MKEKKREEDAKILASKKTVMTATIINPDADKDDIITVTKKINGGLIGIEDRKAWLVKTKKIWNV